MDDNLAIFLIMVVAIGAAVILTSLTAFMRGKPGSTGGNAALEGAGEMNTASRLASENAELRGQVGRLEDRLRVLEAIATDPAVRTEREIESLR